MTYANFKALVIGQGLKWFYKETINSWEFSTYDGPLDFKCVIYKDGCAIAGVQTSPADCDDFCTNYKATAINVG